MQVQALIRDAQTTFSISVKAARVAHATDENYRFQLKGLPARWTREEARRLLSLALKKKGFTQVNIVKTHEQLLLWQGWVYFTVPKPIPKLSAITRVCPTCGALRDSECKSVVKGAFHAAR